MIKIQGKELQGVKCRFAVQLTLGITPKFGDTIVFWVVINSVLCVFGSCFRALVAVILVSGFCLFLSSPEVHAKYNSHLETSSTKSHCSSEPEEHECSFADHYLPTLNCCIFPTTHPVLILMCPYISLRTVQWSTKWLGLYILILILMSQS